MDGEGKERGREGRKGEEEEEEDRGEREFIFTSFMEQLNIQSWSTILILCFYYIC